MAMAKESRRDFLRKAPVRLLGLGLGATAAIETLTALAYSPKEEGKLDPVPGVHVQSDFPPQYTPPEQVQGCHRYHIGRGYDWQKPPYGGQRVSYEKGWSGIADWIDNDGDGRGDRYAMLESFGMGCPENR